MKAILEGYRKILSGLFALFCMTPGLFLIVGLLVLFAKSLFYFVLWLW